MMEKIMAVFTENGVDLENLFLHVEVPSEYYEAVKVNFPRNPIADILFRVRQDNWDILVGEPVIMPKTKSS